ncbi:MAG TPA: hypothetical protein DEQ34_07920 [Balneolaceae bacterium]|nr:hypothetical protein [Balneolaceae bacterium]|tara:strand:+ start:206276 stop:207430 length:1155 start_codon:yes stop_codon:yes gene_type:complete
MKLKLKSIFVVGIWLFSTSVSAQFYKPDIRGYVKELGGVSFSDQFDTFRYDNIIHHRIESTFDLGSGFEFQADLRNRLLTGYTVSNTPGYANYLDNDPGYFDLSWVPVDSRKAVFHSTMDRLQLTYFSENWEISVGRQRLNWGKSMVWNPNDLFNAYSYLDFDYEERPGTDAVSAQYNWSYASSISAGYRFGRTLDESVFALMYRGNIGEYDIQVLGGNYFDHWTLGAGWSGYLKDAGLTGEFSYFHPRSGFFDPTGHFTATLGSNYMLPNAVYLSAELLYNGGYRSNPNPIAALSTPPSADDLFVAETGFFLNASATPSPLSSVSLGFMGSFDRSLFILIPQYSYSLSENIYLLLLSQIMRGSSFSGLTQTPNAVFFRLKWSY